MIYRRVAIGIGLVLLLGAAVTVVAYRKAYGVMVFSEPERIAWCGRVYLRRDAPPRTREEIEADDRAAMAEQLDSLGAAAKQAYASKLVLRAEPPLVEVAKVPPLVGRSLLASPTGTGVGMPCAMVVYREVDSGTYREYVISGGP